MKALQSRETSRCSSFRWPSTILDLVHDLAGDGPRTIVRLAAEDEPSQEPGSPREEPAEPIASTASDRH